MLGRVSEIRFLQPEMQVGIRIFFMFCQIFQCGVQALQNFKSYGEKYDVALFNLSQSHSRYINFLKKKACMYVPEPET